MIDPACEFARFGLAEIAGNATAKVSPRAMGAARWTL